MVSGKDMFSLFLESICPNKLRICSKRTAISRPFLSPASVMTTKCAERYSCHLSFSSEAASDDRIERAEMKTETRVPKRKKRWYQGRRAMGKAARRRCSDAITGWVARCWSRAPGTNLRFAVRYRAELLLCPARALRNDGIFVAGQ